MKSSRTHHSPARRGFIAVWFQLLTGSLGVTLTGGSAYYQWRASVELPQAEAALKAAGYPLDIVQASPPDLPEAGNFGATPFLKGIATRDEDLTPELKGRIATIKALSPSLIKVPGTSKRPDLHPPTDTRESPTLWAAWREWISEGLEWEMPSEQDDAKAVLLALRKKSEPFFPALLEAARTRKHASFVPSQRSRMAAAVQRGDITPDLIAGGSRLIPLARLLALQMDASLAVGEEKEAASLATVLIALRDIHGNDYSLISYLVQLTYDKMLFDIAQRNLATRQMTAPLLTQLQAAFAADNAVRDFERYMIMELALSCYQLEQISKRRDALNAFKSFSSFMQMERAKVDPLAHGLVMAVFDRTQVVHIHGVLDEMQALKSGGLLGFYHRRKELEGLPQPGLLGWLKPHEMLALAFFTDAFSVLMPGIIHTEMRRRMLVTACSLERHWLAGGALPDALSALPKNLLPQIPPDLDGQPLRFRRDKDGWVLWSVGMDLNDDWNGNLPPPPTDAVKDAPWKAADWQWRQPEP